MKKKILFVNDEMVTGGVAKVLNNLLLNIDYQIYDVDLLVLHKHGEMLTQVPKEVKLIAGSSFFDAVDLTFNELVKQHQWKKLLKKLRLLFDMKTGFITYKIKKERSKILNTKYDVEIAFKEGFCSIFVSCGDTPIKINWIHVDYGVMNYSVNHMRLMKNSLKKFDYHVAVSEVVARSFEELFNVNNIEVIHNLILSDLILQKSKENIDIVKDQFTLVSVGRLHYQKAYERLIRVHSCLINEGYKLKTYLVGDGELMKVLVKLINELNIQDSFIMLGQRNNPYPYYRLGDLFVLTSIYEGLPTVVFESLILKVPVLSTKVAGITEQLNNIYGMVVDNDEQSIYQGIKYLLDNPQVLREYRKNLEGYTYNNTELINKFYELIER